MDEINNNLINSIKEMVDFYNDNKIILFHTFYEKLLNFMKQMGNEHNLKWGIETTKSENNKVNIIIRNNNEIIYTIDSIERRI
jgi:hypothetical protein